LRQTSLETVEVGLSEASQFREGEALGQSSTNLLTLFRAKWPTWHSGPPLVAGSVVTRPSWPVRCSDCGTRPLSTHVRRGAHLEAPQGRADVIFPVPGEKRWPGGPELACPGDPSLRSGVPQPGALQGRDLVPPWRPRGLPDHPVSWATHGEPGSVLTSGEEGRQTRVVNA